MKLWRRRPAGPVEYKRIVEVVDTTEDVQAMRLFTVEDYEAAVRYGQSQRTDYRSAFKDGAASARRRPYPHPAWDQQAALTKAGNEGWNRGWRDCLAAIKKAYPETPVAEWDLP